MAASKKRAQARCAVSCNKREKFLVAEMALRNCAVNCVCAVVYRLLCALGYSVWQKRVSAIPNRIWSNVYLNSSNVVV